MESDLLGEPAVGHGIEPQQEAGVTRGGQGHPPTECQDEGTTGAQRCGVYLGALFMLPVSKRRTAGDAARRRVALEADKAAVSQQVQNP